jgi:hypothetical protein
MVYSASGILPGLMRRSSLDRLLSSADTFHPFMTEISTFLSPLQTKAQLVYI